MAPVVARSLKSIPSTLELYAMALVITGKRQIELITKFIATTNSTISVVIMPEVV